MQEKPFKIFSGTSSRYFAEKVCKSLNCKLGKMIVQRFADGEFSVSYEESIRGRDVFLIQSTFPNADNLMELLLMIDAAKRASAKSIVAVIPYFGWARQDRKDKPRVAIAAKLIADMLSTAGINRLITMDLHADQIQGFLDVPVDHLYASRVFIDYMRDLNLDNLVLATPDVGGTKRASAYAKFLEVPMVICYKLRKKANVISDMQVLGTLGFAFATDDAGIGTDIQGGIILLRLAFCSPLLVHQSKNRGNGDAHRAEIHAIAAIGAGNPVLCLIKSANLIDHVMLLHTQRNEMGHGRKIILHLRHVTHAGQHHHHTFIACGITDGIAGRAGAHQIQRLLR